MAEFDSDHEALAANLPNELVALGHGTESALKLFPGSCRALEQSLRRKHLERGNAGRHCKIILTEGRAVHDRALHAVEYLVENRLAGEDSADWNVAAGERL